MQNVPEVAQQVVIPNEQLLPRRGEAKLQEELPELRRERVLLVDDFPPNCCHALEQLLPPDVGVDGGLGVRDSLTTISSAR